MSFEVYHRNSDVEVETSFSPELTEDELDLIGKRIFQDLCEKLYGKDLKLAQEVFEYRFENEYADYLQPIQIRKMVFMYWKTNNKNNSHERSIRKLH